MATKWLKMEKIFKNLLVTNHKAGSIHILYEASLGDPLPKLLKLFPWGHIWALPGRTLFYILKCRLPFVSIWNGLKFCRLVMAKLQVKKGTRHCEEKNS